MRKKNMMSVNIKKIGAQTSVNRLIRENYRNEQNADQYDDGHRAINTDQTADNVYLIDPPDDYDQTRRDRISAINEQRSKQVDYRLKLSNNVEKLRQSGDLQAEKSREVAKTRKLRSDTVDTLGIVVQMPPEMMGVWTREQQTQFFRDCLDYMREHPEEYGRIDTAVIHYDEHSPHMQCLASTLNHETLTSDAKKIVGNKTKMSNRQTHLADAMRSKGWAVRRGVKRVDNPEYQNFRSDMDRIGIEVNRHNDAVLMQVWRDLKKRERDLQAGREALSASREAFTAEIAQIKADAKKDRQRASDAVTEARRIMDQADQRESRAGDILHHALSEQAEAEQVKKELTALIDRADQSIKDAQQATKDLRAGVLKVSRARSQARETEQIGRDLADAVRGLTELDEAQKNRGLSR